MMSLVHVLGPPMMLTRIVSKFATRVIGVMLLLVVAFLLVEMVLRKTGLGTLSGVHEYSAYALAILSSWGLAQTMIERAHIRIDLGHSRLSKHTQCAFDLIAIMAVNMVSWTILLNAWPVFNTSWQNGSLANTPLSTPLWIPQLVWLLGYLWFALTSAMLALRSLLAAFMGDHETLTGLIGIDDGDKAEAKALQAKNNQPLNEAN